MRNKVIGYVLQNHVLAAILVVAAVWLAIEIREVLIALFVAYILMAAISPYVELLQKYKMPKPLAVLIPYLIAISFLVILILSLLPFFITQIQALFQNFPFYIAQEVKLLKISVDQTQLNSFAATGLENLGKGAFAITEKVFGGIFSIISVFVISFYLLVYKEKVREGFASLFPKSEQEKVMKTMAQMEDKLGSWLRGQIILSGFIGVMTWIVLTFLGISFALPLAAIAGLLEIVPTIGPTIAAIPAVIVALTISFPTALIVALSYILVQFFESHLLVPRIMQRAVGLNPIVIIVGIIIGGRLLGPIGALLAVPFLSLLVVVYKNLE